MEQKINKITVKNEQELFAALKLAKETQKEYFDIILEPKTYRFTSPIVIEADGVHLYGKGAKLRGSVRVELSPYKKQDGTVEIPLAELGITDMGRFGGGPYADYWRKYDIPKPRLLEEGLGLELFYEEEKMQLCRYPKKGFINIKEVCGEQAVSAEKETDGSAEGRFIADDEAVKTWKSYKNILLTGYWCWDWATQRHKIESIDSKTGEIKVDEPYHTFGYRPNKDGKGGRFAALNVREALCERGEWVIDREKGILTLIPYEDQSYVDISVCDDIFYADGKECLKIEGFDIAECRGCGVHIENSYKCTVKGLTIRNVGAWGVVCDNSTNMQVEGCTISYTAGGGISLRGGDRENLISSRNMIYKNDITEVGTFHRSYMAAIEIDGVGAHVLENKIYNVPHSGIMYSGNNHIIENNEIDNACYESHDAGAIYTGRNYTFRGNRICYNYIHNLQGLNGMGCRGLYFDDAVSSAEVYCNIFANISFAAIELGGGRDYKFYRNTFKSCRVALKSDDRAGKWERLPPRLLQRLGEVNYKNEKWKKAYPELYNIEENDMFLPLGNEFTENTVIGGDGIAFSNEETARMMKIRNNNFVPDNELLPPKMKGWYHINAFNNKD